MLEKQGKKLKQKIWLDIAHRISRPKRTLTKVNIYELASLSKKFKDKTLVIPGSVLGTGELPSGIKVAALYFSKTALQKIHNAKGKAFGLDELATAGEKTSSMVIVK